MHRLRTIQVRQSFGKVSEQGPTMDVCDDWNKSFKCIAIRGIAINCFRNTMHHDETKENGEKKDSPFNRPPQRE
jgi:hypothetical protein